MIYVYSMLKTCGKPKTMTDVLRQSLADSASVRAVSRATGVPQCSLSRFLAGKQLRLDMAERLAAFFGVEVRPPARGSHGKGKKGG